MTDIDTMGFDDLERNYVERENTQKARVQSLVKAIEELVAATTTDERYLVRCDEICEAVVRFSEGGEPRMRRSW